MLAGIAQPGRTALHFQLKNLIEHTKLTPEMRNSQIAEIPKTIDDLMAADPWMRNLGNAEINHAGSFVRRVDRLNTD